MSLDGLFEDEDEQEELVRHEVKPIIIKDDRTESQKERDREKRRKPLVMTEKTKIPDFNDMLKFCEKHLDDYEVEQFYKHTIPRRLHKDKYQEDRGGGGWSGAVKAAINIWLKMRKEGIL